MKGPRPTSYRDLVQRVTPTARFRILSLDPYVAEGRLVMPYRYFPGPVASHFFRVLRDEGRILGIRCNQCRTVYVPPEGICGRCFCRLHQWIEVGPEGTLLSYTRPRYLLDIHPRVRPLLFGIIHLDGADTGLLHLLGDVDPDRVEIGMRVKAVLAQERRGGITDIQYFRPLAL